MAKKYELTRDVTKAECGWLDRDMKKGETVHPYYGPTYGCVGAGTACSEQPGKSPFFELPCDALRSVSTNAELTRED